MSRLQVDVRDANLVINCRNLQGILYTTIDKPFAISSKPSAWQIWMNGDLEKITWVRPEYVFILEDHIAILVGVYEAELKWRKIALSNFKNLSEALVEVSELTNLPTYVDISVNFWPFLRFLCFDPHKRCPFRSKKHAIFGGRVTEYKVIDAHHPFGSWERNVMLVKGMMGSFVQKYCMRDLNWLIPDGTTERTIVCLSSIGLSVVLSSGSIIPIPVAQNVIAFVIDKLTQGIVVVIETNKSLE